MFSDKFTKIPIMIYDPVDLRAKDKKDCDIIRIISRMDISKIECYYKGENICSKDELDLSWTYFCLSSGEGYMVPLTVEKFEELLNKSSSANIEK